MVCSVITFKTVSVSCGRGVVFNIKHNVDLRPTEFKDVVDGLFEHHDNGHLDEEVSEAATGVALKKKKPISYIYGFTSFVYREK